MSRVALWRAGNGEAELKAKLVEADRPRPIAQSECMLHGPGAVGSEAGVVLLICQNPLDLQVRLGREWMGGGAGVALGDLDS